MCAQTLRQTWETRHPGLQIGRWYFVEVTWDSQQGLSLYVDRQRVGYQPLPVYRPPQPAASMNLYLGYDGTPGSEYPAVTLDELEMLYADRDTLTDIGFVQRGGSA